MRPFTQADLEPEVFSAEVGGHTTALAVLPRVGANLISFAVDGREFIHFDRDSILADSPQMTGCFHMFPTPCALDRGRYTFDGREVIQQKQGKPIDNHGLLRDEVFAITKCAEGITASLEWDETGPVYEGFPWQGRIELRYRVIPRGLRVEFAFENRGDSPAPVGYGIHPFWQFTGDRAEVLVRVPAEHRMALDNYVTQNPTGELIQVEGTRYDLRDFRSLTDLFIDDVFWPRPEGAAAGVAFPREGIWVKIDASPNMRHLVCYSPENRPFVCVENLTSSPDAQNLYAKGRRERSGLTIVEPGGQMAASVSYTVEEWDQ